MKNLAALCLLVGFVLSGCSGSQVNSYKVKVAEKAKAAVEKELNEAFMGLEIEGCDSEAEMIGDKVYDKLISVLRADDKSAQKSAIGNALVQQVCGLAVSSIGDLVLANSGDYKCLAAVGSEKLEKVGQDLCRAIDL
tara:strand:- start:9876 stop:10286 length:411 start_codon:yes stop_codon:yes gene_type:complete